MPRFNAAKSWKKLDDDLSGKFNYLCDLLDEGYSSVALINNHEIAIDINPKDGIKIVNDGSSIFSLDPLTGEIVIGKYDGLISDLETDLGTAYNDIAQQLGYTDYDDMVAEAIAGNTIINGGWLRTSLIQANTILFNQLASSAVTDITDTIDLGGRNLLKNTGTPVTNASYLIASYDMGDEWPVAGETYTLSVKFTLGADRTHLSLFTPEGTVLLTTVADADKNSLGVASKTFTMSYAVGYTPADGYTNLVVYQMPSGGSAASTIEWVKLEKGNKATDWTPAPEDKLSEGVSYAGVEIDATNGFVSTATIGGNTIQTKANATEGFSIYKGSDKVFGVDTDGRVFATSLSNIDNSTYYMTYGYLTNPGIECYGPNTPVDPTESIKWFNLSKLTDNGFAMFDVNEKRRMDISPDGAIRFYDHNEITRFSLQANGGITLLDINGIAVFSADGGPTNVVELACKANVGMRIGVDSTGPYYVKNGTKTYF